MIEKKSSELIEKEKCLRGLGILMLCMLLAAAGIWSFSSDVIYVSGQLTEQEFPICSVENHGKQIAFTFECVDDNESLEKILDSLSAKEVRATFFVTGDWAEKYPAEVRAIQSLGHELGNYGNGSSHMAQFSRKKYKECILQTERTIKELTGIEMELFRPPLGIWNDQTLHTIASAGYYPVCWSVDSMDWKDYGSASILQKVCGELEAGAIIRFQADARYTPESVESLIECVKTQGYEIATVGEMIFGEMTEQTIK